MVDETLGDDGLGLCCLEVDAFPLNVHPASPRRPWWNRGGKTLNPDMTSRLVSCLLHMSQLMLKISRTTICWVA